MPKTPTSTPDDTPADEAATMVIAPETAAETPGIEAPPFDQDAPVFEGSLSAAEPLVAPDGHVTLSQEDIEARDAES